MRARAFVERPAAVRASATHAIGVRAGLTPSTAVQTFARAWTRTKAKSFYHITVGAGVVRYSDVPIDHDLVVVSATGDPWLNAPTCADTS